MSLRLFAIFGLAIAGLSIDGVASSPVTAQSQIDLSFPLDSARRERNFDSAAKDVAGADRNIAGLANDIRAALRTQDLIGPELARLGLSGADLGDVLALAQFSAVMLADGARTDDPTPAQIRGIRSAIIEAGGAQLAAMPAGEKQDLADRLLFIIVVQQTVAEVLEGNPALDSWMQEFATFNSQILGFDVTAVKVGPDGFDNQSKQSPATRPPQNAPSADAPAGTIDRNGVTEIHGARYDYYFDGTTSINRINVLFKDGRACHDCLEDFIAGRMGEYKTRNAGDMGRWTRQGSDYIVRYDSGRTTSIEASELRQSARKGVRFNAALTSSRGVTLSTVQSLNVDSLMLGSDGRFRWGSEGGVIAGNAVGGRAGPTLSGRYTIDGYAIRFDFDDGRSETKAFLLYDPDDLFLLIGGQAFYVDG